VQLHSSLVKFEFNTNRASYCDISIEQDLFGKDNLAILLQKMPNLSHLSIDSLFTFMNGHQWENIITNYLPKLKIFRCRMKNYFYSLDDIEKRVKDLICSFQSHFWLENHQWFIRCQIKSEKQGEYYILYHTLPCFFTYPLAIAENLWSASTCPHQNDYWLSDSVQSSFVKVNSLMEVSNLQELDTNRVTSLQRSRTFCERISTICRPNLIRTKDLTNYMSRTCCLDTTHLIPRSTIITELHVELPFDKHFLNFVPKLDQLTSMEVSLSINYTNQSDLQVLLNQAPNLYSLSIIFSTISTLEFFLAADIRNVSIRKLSFERMWYNRKQCAILCRSSLGKQCETLIIGVQNKHCIIHLINEMIKLRSLTIQTYDIGPNTLSSPGKHYDLITWLQFSLPSAIKIAKYNHCKNTIQFWIR
jgi:hypothetical protein